ncbi:MAG: Glutamine--fructose-6-phosphate aminotransferase (isomerizing) [Syntrophus sp. PtaU1.Bin208]|nr:MAG: Glutamine--fructose-6-phosphate aminotransferase (isomerizing) [Syntrophus sp. PtaU1.Bin208]
MILSKMLKDRTDTFWSLLRNMRIFFGSSPQQVPGPALIFFPVEPTVFCCGLAGILTFKAVSVPPENVQEVIRKIKEGLPALKERNLQGLLSGAFPVDSYLSGSSQLARLSNALEELKQEAAAEHLFFSTEEADGLYKQVVSLRDFLSAEEFQLEHSEVSVSTQHLEIINGRLGVLKDFIWTLERDILDNLGQIAALCPALSREGLSREAFSKYRKLNYLLNCLDRLEVRGRDSAGIQISFTLKGEQVFEKALAFLRENSLYEDFLRRSQPGDLLNGSIGVSLEPEKRGNATVAFTYKTSAIIGELGRNVRKLREAIAGDALFPVFARFSTGFETAFAHTRWASVGSITDDNCHPINNHALAMDKADHDAGLAIAERTYPLYGRGNWFISVVLNGDIDNYASLRTALEAGREVIPREVTTDTKIIPLQIEKYLLEGHDLQESFRRAVSDFEGSHAIAMVSNLAPEKVFLALKGSGQTIYVGLAPDSYIFASELYGIVEGASRFVKMDGEKTSGGSDGKSSGQIFVLDQSTPGDLSGISAIFYDGTPFPLTDRDVQNAEITTRDIDRGTYPHYFMKEITESALSVKKTLRGRYRVSRGKNGAAEVVFNLGPDVVPEGIKEALRNGTIRRILVIGHGTAAVAGSAVADAMERCLQGAPLTVEARIASELSGFCLSDNLSDTLVVPITQSGTTTDTNRAVAMAAERGATILTIVNRRQSDITSKSHGVFYTSDGRDIEMSVASTKAFYSQIIAGHLLALFFAQILKTLPDTVIAEELAVLEQAPDAMGQVLSQKEAIRQAAERFAKRKTYWAVVGSGPNKAAADEIRIKLSELCYKTISTDIVENKKHIDLSAEPLIVVCAAGNPEAVMGDIVKDVAIFKAHKAAVVVFADAEEDRFDGLADAVIRIPRAPLPLPVILNTVAGHLLGYYSALSIDADALFLKEYRSQLNRIMVEQDKRKASVYERIADREFRRLIRDFSAQFHERRNSGAFSFTNVKTVSDIALLLKYVVGKLPLEDYWNDFKNGGDLLSPVDLLDISLGQAIDELSRPVDAIRHQAKTVTVGTSRKEESLTGVLFDLLKELGYSTKALVGKTIMELNRIQEAVAEVRGYTLYGIDHLDADGAPGDEATIAIIKRDGISREMTSRTETSNRLMGTKKIMARTRRLYIGKGKLDGMSIIILPVLGDGNVVRNLLLVHVVFSTTLPLKNKIDIMGVKYNDILNLTNEYNLPWKDSYLERIPLEILLGEPAETIVEAIRKEIEQPEKEKEGA